MYESRAFKKTPEKETCGISVKMILDLSENDTEENKKPDRIAYRASLMKCLLMLKDTNDGYCMGDRIITNAKFQILFSGVSRHTKSGCLHSCITL